VCRISASATVPPRSDFSGTNVFSNMARFLPPQLESGAPRFYGLAQNGARPAPSSFTSSFAVWQRGIAPFALHCARFFSSS
ncbi:hypothetical protein, partial [Nevskia soli]|uniref:hypothetical protein n=1 Tax=Nevskia soli TaxID=418856 RepID=UPI001C5C9150